MEFVVITYPADRTVYVDDEGKGLTNIVFRVSSGTHSFHLGEPKDYNPPAIEIQVTDTSPLQPLELVFKPQ